MAISSSANFHQPNPQELPAPCQNGSTSGHQASFSLALANQEPLLNSDPGHNSAIEHATPRSETLPRKSSDPAALAVAVKMEDEGKEVITYDASNWQIICQIPTSCSTLTVWDIVQDNVAVVANKMKVMQEGPLEELKTAIRMVMETTDDDQHHKEDFIYLQKYVQVRPDLTPAMLLTAHPVQLEILVALRMGITAYLHQNVSLPRSRLTEIFFYERCKNMACQITLPAGECKCDICCYRKGFCNLCMCVICSKFDFEVNTCCWIGCDACSHWTHTECAIREGQIKTAITVKNGIGHTETLFICMACQETSELLGWVRNVFQHCVQIWDRAALSRELEYVHKVFSVSEDLKGKKLFEKCANLIERLKIVPAEPMSPEVLVQALQEVELDDTPKINENEEPVHQNTDPQDGCNQLSEYVQEAADEKAATNKKARLCVEASTDSEQQLMAAERLRKEKAKAAAEEIMAVARLRQKQEAEELDRVVRLKKAEAEMFHLKAKEAQVEAERLQLVAMAKLEKAERDYTNLYLKHRMEDAEAEKHLIFHKLNMQEMNQQMHPPPPPTTTTQLASSSSSAAVAVVPAQNTMLCKILDALSRLPASSKSGAVVSKVHELLREALGMPCSSCTVDVHGGEDPLQMMMLNEIYDMFISLIK
ncbi:hypothetical protein E2562_014537 [Oryza meyeriana var. granulata]|uniref:OBERON-like protein n=1 Tax=Oryza meyeriana var. granulata TaxID=110450 RepID=A0A6G1EJZ8_9ORYZ|nr:hypothetical protein E2562_014537 [Oryza meyeriana var. granulata]